MSWENDAQGCHERAMSERKYLDVILALASQSGGLPKLSRHDFDDAFVIRLRDNDRQTWSELLAWTHENCGDRFEEVKKKSPFAAEVVIVIDYGVGFVTFGGDIEKWFKVVLEKAGYPTYDGSTYCVSMKLPSDNTLKKNLELFSMSSNQK